MGSQGQGGAGSGEQNRERETEGTKRKSVTKEESQRGKTGMREIEEGQEKGWRYSSHIDRKTLSLPARLLLFVARRMLGIRGTKGTQTSTPQTSKDKRIFCFCRLAAGAVQEDTVLRTPAPKTNVACRLESWRIPKGKSGRAKGAERERVAEHRTQRIDNKLTCTCPGFGFTRLT